MVTCEELEIQTRNFLGETFPLLRDALEHYIGGTTRLVAESLTWSGKGGSVRLIFYCTESGYGVETQSALDVDGAVVASALVKAYRALLISSPYTPNGGGIVIQSIILMTAPLEMPTYEGA